VLGSTGQPRSAARPRHPSRGRRAFHLRGRDAQRHPVSPRGQRPSPRCDLDPRGRTDRPPYLRGSGRGVHPGWGGVLLLRQTRRRTVPRSMLSGGLRPLQSPDR
jgi:hypothetical protein